MRIGILSHSAMSVYHFRMPIAKALKQENHEVFLLVPKDEYDDKLKNSGFEVVNYDLQRSSTNPFIVFKNFLNLIKVLKKLNLDILQTSAHKSNTFGVIAAKFVNIKYIFALVEGLGSFYIDDDFKTKLIRLNINLLYKIYFKIANKFIFVNESDALFMKMLGLNEEKICIIKSVGVNLKQFFPIKIQEEIKNDFLKKYNLKQKPIVLMIARALWHKGIKEFYESASLLKNEANFILVGARDDNKSCAPLDFLENENVLYLGARDDIAFLLNLCDIFVLPSYKEGYPRTVLEAKACKKACVVSDCDGCVEAILNGYDGLYCKVKNGKDLSQKIHWLIEDERLRDNLANNAFKEAIKFDEQLIAQKYLQIYKESIKNV